jgi:hypothetical protein
VKKRVTVTLTFELDTMKYPLRQWFLIFNQHMVDVLRHINTNPKLGTLIGATSQFDALNPQRLDHRAAGPAKADLPKVFTFCALCPNTSWCRTQGQCVRAEKVRATGSIEHLTRETVNTRPITPIDEPTLNKIIRELNEEELARRPIKKNPGRAAPGTTNVKPKVPFAGSEKPRSRSKRK